MLHSFPKSLSGSSSRRAAPLVRPVFHAFSSLRQPKQGPRLTALRPVAANVYLPKDRVTNNHQGYGFVEFKSEEDADYVRLCPGWNALHCSPSCTY